MKSEPLEVGPDLPRDHTHQLRLRLVATVDDRAEDLARADASVLVIRKQTPREVSQPRLPSALGVVFAHRAAASGSTFASRAKSGPSSTLTKLITRPWFVTATSCRPSTARPAVNPEMVTPGTNDHS